MHGRFAWFGPKTLGWGLTVRSWEGLVVVGVFVAAMVGARFLGLNSADTLAIRVVLAVGFGLIVALTYDSAKP